MVVAHGNEFLNHVLDLLQVFGPVTGRKMFGGYGIFHDSVMFALIADDVLYFKANEDTAPEFDSLNLPPFVYNKQGKDVVMSYREAPDAALEDANVMARWATLAFGVAQRATGGKKEKE